jgi:hypothetical protein
MNKFSVESFGFDTGWNSEGGIEHLPAPFIYSEGIAYSVEIGIAYH